MIAKLWVFIQDETFWRGAEVDRLCLSWGLPGHTSFSCTVVIACQYLRTFVERKAGLFDLGSARCPTPFQISATGSQARTESLAESVSTSKPPEISNCSGIRFHLSHGKPPQALRLLSLWGGRTCGQSLSIEDSAQSNPKPKTNQKGFLCIKRFTSLFKVAPVHSPATISIFDKVLRRLS